MGEKFSRSNFLCACLKRNGEFSYIGSVDDIPKYDLDVNLCGELARENKAVLSIAHPNHTFDTLEEFERLVPSYVERGVNAIEIHYSTAPEWIEAILRMRKRFDLLLTFGSDFHADTNKKEHGDLGDLNPNIDEAFMNRELERILEAV